MNKNRTLLTFFATVFTITGGTLAAKALTASDLADAAPRDEVVIRKGSTAKLRSVCVTEFIEKDGGVQLEVKSSGSYVQATQLSDGGEATETLTKNTPACSLPEGSSTRAARELLDGAGLVCFRKNLRLEK